MARLLSLPLLGFLLGAQATAQVSVPPCNAFDAAGNPVLTIGTTTTANCTDYFGAPNWANSPLPAGTVTGATLIAGGSGYGNPVLIITDPTGTGATGTATATAGVITSVSASGGGGYILPQVAIVDVGVGGRLAAPTCGGAAQPACGAGAMATATLGGPFTGGMLKFQDTLPAAPSGATLAGGLQRATPDTTTFPGSDYYEIVLVQYAQKMHASLPPTTLRGYVQVPTGSVGCPASAAPSYLGPVIVAQKDRPVRVKFTNCLPAGAAGDLFLPTDTTFMGAGMDANGNAYTQNRATLHLHGGATPWISDGTPHQWTAPVAEAPPAPQRGASVSPVPDMYFVGGAVVPQCSATLTTSCSPTALPAGATNDPGQGSLAFYWTNQQGGRLMFYHDHAYGITRLDVYAGEAAGYLLVDPAEEDGLAAASAPGTVGTSADLAHLIPLVIQDKTFVPGAAQVTSQDPTWAGNFGTTPGTANLGDLWFPHVYMTNQNPVDAGGGNAFGRWDYGPWFHPAQTTLTAARPAPTDVTVPCTSRAFPGVTLAPSATCPNCGCPITPNPSGTPEGFMDTPVVNGVAYPVLHVAPAAYRFHILNAANDRSWNLSWFLADATGADVAMLPAAPPVAGAALPLCTAVNPITMPGLDLGLAMGLLDASGNPMNGTGLPAGCWPNYGPAPGIPVAQSMWAADGRAGGAPDPRGAGPAWIQIGSEGGLLPAPVVIPPTPINYEQNTRSITIGNVAIHGLWLGPAERADVIVDFSRFAGMTLILYNDAATPVPAFDSRNDYFTGDADQTPIGGAPATQPGYGPNTRTLMQVKVDGTAPNAVPFSLTTLRTAFASSATGPGLFASTQPTPVVPEAAYGSAYARTFPNTYASIYANSLTFTPLAPLSFDNLCTTTPALPAQCGGIDQKAIQELFTLDYGRMNATLGTELPFTSFANQTTIPLGYVDPPTEIIRVGDTQLWKVTHNGVDTHFVHFHLFNVQLVNRMGWDGSLRPPDANELGWKDTVRMNPLESILVAMQPIAPTLPWPVPNSIRYEDVTMGAGTTAQFTNVDPFTNNPYTTSNGPTNYGWEYVWHCHILGHEENDMMRPMVFVAPPPAPSGLVAVRGATPGQVVLSWIDGSASETKFVIQRDTSTAFTAPTTLPDVGPSTPTNLAGEGTSWGGTITATDTPPAGGPFYYRVQAVDDGWRNPGLAQPYNTTPATVSTWSNVATSPPLSPTVTFTGAPATAAYNASFAVRATTTATSMPAITGTPGVCTVGAVGGTPAGATATVTMVSGTGTCTLTAAWPADLNYTAAVATQATAASRLGSATTLTGFAPSPAVVGQPVTVGVRVASSVALVGGASGPTGAVTVTGARAGQTSRTCTATLTAGVGSCVLALPSAGAWTLTASYPGDPNFNGSTSAAATEQVRDFSITIVPTSQTVVGGTRARAVVALRSLNGFSGTVTLGCSGTYPASWSCTVTPATLTLPANGLAGAILAVNTVLGNPGAHAITVTGRSGTGVPATGGLTRTATSNVTTSR